MSSITDALKAKHPEATGDTIAEVIATMESGGGGSGALLRPAMTTPAISVDVEATHNDVMNVDGAVVENVFALDPTTDPWRAISSNQFSVTLTYTRKTDSQEVTETIVVPTAYNSENINIDHPSINMYGQTALYSYVDSEHPESNILIGLEGVLDESNNYSHHNLVIIPRGQAKLGTNVHIEISEIEWQTLTDEFELAYYVVSHVG